MPELTQTQRDQMFPRLTADQIARLQPLGVRRRVVAGEVIFDQGAMRRSFYVVLEGGLEIVSPAPGGEVQITVEEPGQFTGEVDMLSGRPSLVRARAITDGELLEIDPANLHRLVQIDAELSEILLRAFANRRVELVANALGDVVLIGSRHCADTHRLNAFLARNGHPHTYLEVERDAGVQALL